MPHPLAWIDDELQKLQQGDLRRRLPAPIGRQGVVIDHQGQQLVNFASNDYLGLAGDARLVEAAARACSDYGVGRGASPLVSGRAPEHELLEARLAEFEGAGAALLFPTGYAANSGIIPALVERTDGIFADAKNHASLIDGCRLSYARTHRYAHNDVERLEWLLERTGPYRRRLIVTDTLFSMDGDVAPLQEISQLAARHGAMLMLDEAHATGVFGPHGRGVAEALGLDDEHLIRVGTLSKALGAAGGFVCGPRALIEWLANRARSYVFSTAQPGAASAAALVALDIVQQEPERRRELLQKADALRQRLRSAGWNTGESSSQIIPLIVGSAAKAVQLSSRLRERGFWVPAIRPPATPPNESLLRISLTAAHTPEMIDRLVSALGEPVPST